MTTRQDADGWSARLGHLTALARVDGLAIVVAGQGTPTTYAGYNMPAIAWSATPAARTIATALQQRTPGQLNAMGMPLADGRNAGSLAAIPIVWKDQLLGALVAAAIRPMDPGDMTNLASAAEIVALDLADANVSWRAQRQTEDLEGRLRASRELSRALRMRDIEALLDRAVQQVAELYTADGASIMLLGEDGHLTVRASRGLSAQAKNARRQVGDGISGSVVQSGQPTLLSGPVAGGSDDSVAESMIAPLRAGDRILGVVSVKHRSAQPRYGQPQLASLALVAQDIASAYAFSDELLHAEDDRQQAITLFELSRFATLGTDPANDLVTAAAMLAGTMGHGTTACACARRPATTPSRPPRWRSTKPTRSSRRCCARRSARARSSASRRIVPSGRRAEARSSCSRRSAPLDSASSCSAARPGPTPTSKRISA